MDYEKAHYFNGHMVNFDINQEYESIKFRIDLGYNHSKLKTVKALRTVFDIGLLDAKNICESGQWLDIFDVKIAIKLFDVLGPDVVTFKASTVAASNDVKLKNAQTWYNCLSKKERKYVDILIRSNVPKAS